jgi:hypothetical protein
MNISFKELDLNFKEEYRDFLNIIEPYLDKNYGDWYKAWVGYCYDSKHTNIASYFIKMLDIFNSNDKMYLLNVIKTQERLIYTWGGIHYWLARYKLGLSLDKIRVELDKLHNPIDIKYL